MLLMCARAENPAGGGKRRSSAWALSMSDGAGMGRQFALAARAAASWADARTAVAHPLSCRPSARARRGAGGAAALLVRPQLPLLRVRAGLGDRALRADRAAAARPADRPAGVHRHRAALGAAAAPLAPDLARRGDRRTEWTDDGHDVLGRRARGALQGRRPARGALHRRGAGPALLAAR